jgi:hypothetical protein
MTAALFPVTAQEEAMRRALIMAAAAAQPDRRKRSAALQRQCADLARVIVAEMMAQR